MTRTPFWIAIGVIAAILLAASIWAGVRWLRGRMQRSGERRVAERYEPGQVRQLDTAANFFGFGSKGSAQVRGSGVLALTPSELWFSRYALRDDHAIALARVSEVALVSSHLRKKILGRKLLFVRFRDEHGEEDTAAWMVDDASEWKRAVEHWVAQAAPARAPVRASEDTDATPIPGDSGAARDAPDASAEP
ncbi:hypothetical protein [Haliangium ochraceum]|uniref:Uncharacterized protein n=1 Tax=Haliangium ochraceum (strain DSM 14365 / JCM 11303 / SMP-2) TaxID=502025 RepID=D0LWT0_HALO1|nr:hypothetical protein [Haliangium ochraceum]ACY14177.1 hypothetical protein Hoch_1627 [Haliangium ochraceum DSM 14365]